MHEPDAFDAILGPAYQRDSSEAKQLMEDIGNEVNLFSLAEELPKTEDLLDSEDDAPIIKLINAMLGEAIKEGASDIHIETFEKDLIIRVSYRWCITRDSAPASEAGITLSEPN